MKPKLITALLVTLLSTMAYSRQQPVGYSNTPLTDGQKRQAVDSIISTIKQRYIFPDIALKIEKHLREQLSKKAYAKVTDGNAFADMLTADLQAAGHDKHLHAEYSAETIPVEKEHELMSIPADEREGIRVMLERTNYGINKVDVLKGNIGYIDINVFVTPEIAGDKYAAMMNYIAHTEALILDLRNCGGSMSPDAIPFICSYFFESPVHLNDIRYRKGDKLTQSWTYAYVPGKKYLNKPIYVLISGSTFSGAEELAYDLKNLKRATIIGQPTGGGANPGGVLRITDHFKLFVPVGQAINPITKANWEGVGVQPDTLINTKLAFYKAQQMAFKHIASVATDQNWKDALDQWSKEADATRPKIKPVIFELKGFDTAKEVFVAGTFNDWNAGANKLERKDGKWIATAEGEAGKLRYKFIVDGQWITDPANPQTESNGPNTDSVKNIE